MVRVVVSTTQLLYFIKTTPGVDGMMATAMMMDDAMIDDGAARPRPVCLLALWGRAHGAGGVNVFVQVRTYVLYDT